MMFPCLNLVLTNFIRMSLIDNVGIPKLCKQILNYCRNGHIDLYNIRTFFRQTFIYELIYAFSMACFIVFRGRETQVTIEFGTKM